MNSHPFQHAVIIGTGLLGTSLGLAMRKHNLAKIITGVGRKNSNSATIAQQRGAIDRTSDDPVTAITAPTPADLIILCVPIRQFPEILKQIAPHLSPGTILTDVGSTKTQVMRWAAELLPPTVHFIGSHPMAGSEKTGPEAARDDLYTNATCLLCPPEKQSPESTAAFRRIESLWQSLGMRTVSCSPQDHDRRVAAVSHLPHAMAFALMRAAGKDPAALEAAAGGFTDMTRIAGSDPTMWTDIYLSNRDALLAAINTFSAELNTLKSAIERNDENAIRAYVEASKRTRESFITQRSATRPTSKQ
jgi:prephenate dehydrogenase